MNGVPLQRVSQEVSKVTGAQGDAGSGVRSWVSGFWRRYRGLSVTADPLLTTVWIRGHCLDVSIYDRDWPESYRY